MGQKLLAVCSWLPGIRKLIKKIHSLDEEIAELKAELHDCWKHINAYKQEQEMTLADIRKILYPVMTEDQVAKELERLYLQNTGEVLH